MSEENKDINIDEILSSEAGKEKVNALIQAALDNAKKEHEDSTSGLKENKDKILKEKKELEQKLNELLVKSGNLEEVENKIKSERDNEWTGKFETIKNENESLKKEIEEFKNVQKLAKLNAIAIKEVTDFNIHQASLEDAQEKFAREFDFDASGNLINKAGKINDFGKPYTAKDFYNDLQKSKPHWFNGVGGSGTTSASQKTAKEMTVADFDKMTRAEYQKWKRENQK